MKRKHVRQHIVEDLGVLAEFVTMTIFRKQKKAKDPDPVLQHIKGKWEI